jgi:CheY-like chemotaxis protein
VQKTPVEETARSRQQHRRGVSSTRRGLVLVVEDNPNDWEIYGKILWYNGFDVLYAQDGATACELLERYRPDLVLLDLMLPDMDGFELCRRLKKAAANGRRADRDPERQAGCRIRRARTPGGVRTVCGEAGASRRRAAHSGAPHWPAAAGRRRSLAA